MNEAIPQPNTASLQPPEEALIDGPNSGGNSTTVIGIDVSSGGRQLTGRNHNEIERDYGPKRTKDHLSVTDAKVDLDTLQPVSIPEAPLLELTPDDLFDPEARKLKLEKHQADLEEYQQNVLTAKAHNKMVKDTKKYLDNRKENDYTSEEFYEASIVAAELATAKKEKKALKAQRKAQESMSLSDVAELLAEAEHTGDHEATERLSDLLFEKTLKHFKKAKISGKQVTYIERDGSGKPTGRVIKTSAQDQFLDRVLAMKDRKLDAKKRMDKAIPVPVALDTKQDTASPSEPYIADTEAENAVAKHAQHDALIEKVNATGERFESNISRLPYPEQVSLRKELVTRIDTLEAGLGGEAKPYEALLGAFEELNSQLEIAQQAEHDALIEKVNATGERFESNISGLSPSEQAVLRQQLATRIVDLHDQLGAGAHPYQASLDAFNEFNSRLESAATEAQAKKVTDPNDGLKSGELNESDVQQQIVENFNRIISEFDNKMDQAKDVITHGGDPETTIDALISSSTEYLDLVAQSYLENVKNINVADQTPEQIASVKKGFVKSIREEFGLSDETPVEEQSSTSQTPADKPEVEGASTDQATDSDKSSDPEPTKESKSKETEPDKIKELRATRKRDRLSRAHMRNVAYLQARHGMGSEEGMSLEDAETLANAEEKVFFNPGHDMYSLQAKTDFQRGIKQSELDKSTDLESRRLLEEFYKIQNDDSLDLIKRHELMDANQAAHQELIDRSFAENGAITDEYPSVDTLRAQTMEWQGPERYHRGERRLKKIGQKILGNIPLLRRNIQRVAMPEAVAVTRDEYDSYNEQLDKVSKLQVNDYMDNPAYITERRKLDDMWSVLQNSPADKDDDTVGIPLR